MAGHLSIMFHLLQHSANQLHHVPPPTRSECDERSEAPPAAALAPPPAATPKPAASAAEWAEAALRAVIAGGGLSALKAALKAAPREVRKSSVGV